MVNVQRPIVNQRLYYCRLHLQWLAEQLDLQLIPKSLLLQSLGESVIYHLVLAYRAYLSEIATAYALPASSLDSAAELVMALAAKNSESAEAAELQLLEISPCWLTDLLACFQSPSVVHGAKTKLGTATMISLTEIDSSQDLSLNKFEYYLKQLNELISEQRTRLEEW